MTVLDNIIHHTAIIGPYVKIGHGNVIGPYSIIEGNTQIGDNNWIGAGVCIGTAPDIVGIPALPKDFSDANTIYNTTNEFGVSIGNGNTFKEHVTIHRGSHRTTSVSNNCYLMPKSHLGHDCWIGDAVLVSPSAQIAGHVAVGSRAVIGMGALVHQFSSVGPVSMVAMGCCVRGRVDIGRTVVGEPHRVSGINRVGLIRFLGQNDAEHTIKCLKSKNFLDLPPSLSAEIARWEEKIVLN